MKPERVTVHVNGLAFSLLRQGNGAPLVLLHGFTGCADSWRPLFNPLVESRCLVAIDLIGHGLSAAPADAGRYSYTRTIDDLAAVTAALGIGRAAWLGYSLGGRLALGLAIKRPELVAALIVESATPGLADEGERSCRHDADEALAARIEARGMEAFVAEWESLPMWATQRSLPPAILALQRKRRLANSPTGLANSLRGMGQGAQPSLWSQLWRIQAPVLLIAGARDAKFAAIALRMAEEIPDATLRVFPSTGHAVHLENPEHFMGAVNEFLVERDDPALRQAQEVSR